MWGHWEIIVIVLIAVLIFGPKKIPELMRGLGKGIREFKNSMKDEDTGSEQKELPPKFNTEEEKKETNHSQN